MSFLMQTEFLNGKGPTFFNISDQGDFVVAFFVGVTITASSYIFNLSLKNWVFLVIIIVRTLSKRNSIVS